MIVPRTAVGKGGAASVTETEALPGLSWGMSEDREGQAEEARRRLEETERRADEDLEQAAEELRELTEEQEAHAERIRKAAREPTGPLLPNPPDAKD
jgi:predicted trehalose synthase